jgi:ABC-type Fe3+ transport system substrate-binding protein
MTRIARFGLSLAAVLAGAMALSPAPLRAQDWQAQWAKTVAAAEQEGALVLQSQPNQAWRSFVLSEFPKVYPKIKVELSVTREPEFLVRIRTERQAGRYLWDVAVAGGSAGFALAQEGIVDPFLPELIDPSLKDPKLWGGWDQAFLDEAHKYVFSIQGSLIGPFYNALLLAPDKIEGRGLAALLDPQFKGKIVWQEPTINGAGRTQAQLIRAKLGNEGLKKLLFEQSPILVSQINQVLDTLAHGLAWISIGTQVRSLMEPYTKAGIKTDLRTMGNGPDVTLMTAGGSTVYVFNRRPHPNATRVFLGWLLSRDVQGRLAEAMDQASRRQDVTPTTPPDTIPVPGALYITPQREDMEAYQDETTRLIKEWREAGRGK